MSEEYNFQKELKKSIEGADPKLDRKELLEDIFKIYTAKLFEIAIQKSKTPDRLPYEALVEIKKNLINEFRHTSLEMIQMSVEQYEKLFESTVKEIVESAALAHPGQDSAIIQSKFDINIPRYKETHNISPGGIILPN
jgi:hypothetical protein